MINLRFSGDVRANSFAVAQPMPEEAPVIRTVLPSRRLRMLDIFLVVGWVRRGRRGREIAVRGVRVVDADLRVRRKRQLPCVFMRTMFWLLSISELRKTV